MSSLPLEDLFVVDLTIARAGPTAVRMLADWGADVVRLEKPGLGTAIGSRRRHGHDYQNLHRNKRLMAVDLKTEKGRAVFMRLAQRADVVVENWRADVKRRLGVDYEAVRSVNPRIIYASISGFGQTGPYRQRPGVDQIAQGMGGLMSVTGLKGQGPVRVGTAISDLAAGMYLSFGILAALHERDRSGEGQFVHTSLLEAMISMLDFQAARFLVEGEVPGQEGNDHPTLAPMGVFPAADGHVNLAASSDALFQRLCTALAIEHLLEQPQYADPPARFLNRQALNEAVATATRQHGKESLIELLNEAGVPCGPINRIDEVFEDPQVQHLGIATPLEHERLGAIRLVGQPIHMERTPYRLRRRSPEQGEHSRELLEELGYDATEVEELFEDGVVG